MAKQEKIKPLGYTPDTDRFGNCYGAIPPTTRMIVDKINEIIEYLNHQQNEFNKP